MRERQVSTLPGVPMVLILLALLGLCGWWLWQSVEAFVSPLPPLILAVLFGCCFLGLFIVQPKKTVTLRVRSFQSS